jgi:hypothetical protein
MTFCLCQSCLSVYPSVRQSVTQFVRTITPVLQLLLKWNFIYGKSMMWGSVVHKGHNCSIHVIWVIALCWFFLSNFVWTITPDLMLLFKWNFIYEKSMMRGSAVHKGYNSSMHIFWVIALCCFFLSTLVRTTTPDQLLLLKWNFMYGKSMIGSAALKVHNSSINIFWVIALCCFLSNFVRSITLILGTAPIHFKLSVYVAFNV